MNLSDHSASCLQRGESRYREMARFRSNQTLELTATRCALTFKMTISLPLQAMLALGGGRSAYSR